MLDYLSEYLQMTGHERIDWILKTKEEQLFTTSEEGNKYFLKKWYAGKECDVHKEQDVLDAVKNLTNLHQSLYDVDIQISDKYANRRILIFL